MKPSGDGVGAIGFAAAGGFVGTGGGGFAGNGGGRRGAPRFSSASDMRAMIHPVVPAMCCFSQPVRHVSKTRILARPLDGSRQLLVYSMSLVADAHLAMVLPIPVPPSSREDAVRFVDMSSCPKFFDLVDTLFPAELTRGAAAFDGGFFQQRSAPLVVHEVGDFEASFVPSRADFDRLDERFRLPASVWDALPMYADWGFCVFKLRAKEARLTASAPSSAPEQERGLIDRLFDFFGRERATSGGPASFAASTTHDFHPMAFEFPRRDPTRLFFPTVHVHDGAVHSKARFDHTLYCQVQGDRGSVKSDDGHAWQRSPHVPNPASPEASALPAPWVGDAVRWLDPHAHAYRHTLVGEHPNQDIYVELPG